jgi:hypothetical protein
MIEKKIEGETKIGKGPVVTYAPAVQNNLRELILDTAQERKSFSTSPLLALPADTDAFAYSNGGVIRH